MSSYVISDIHGELELFLDLLQVINLQDDDTLYILGDVFDRGAHPVTVMEYIMDMPNVVFIAGNHELMAAECFEFLTEEITEESLEALSDDDVLALMDWVTNGGDTTISELQRRSPERREEIMEYVRNAELYREVETESGKYLLVHAGLGNFSPDRDIEDYDAYELLWDRPDYEVRYFEDKFVVTGHTPTQSIPENPDQGFIYRKNGHIAIDCGAFFPGGRLAALCLDTGEEFYSFDKV